MFLYMCETLRQQLISNHKLYVEQARKRLLLQFEDVSDEADKFAEEWHSKATQGLVPDRHNPEFIQERADEVRIVFYNLLTDMHDQTRLSVIAGMYHGWDKQLREWLSKELYEDTSLKEIKAAIWKAPFAKMIELLEYFDWQVREQEYFNQLDTCRLVVNVYKHGLGDSFDELKKEHPEFLKDAFDDGLGTDELDPFLDHTHLKVTDAHIAAFSDAIIAFWNDVPERTPQLLITHLPPWLLKSIEKDFKNRAPMDNA